MCDVVPRGFSGYNTRYNRMIMDKVFGGIATNEVACVTILLGSNDANEPNSPGGQHVPLDEYSQNLTHMITHLDSIGIPKERIILMSPPNYFHEAFIHSCTRPELPIKSDHRVKEYAQVCAKVAIEQSVNFLDLYHIFSSHPNSADLFIDGLHFSSKGAELLYENLCPLVVDQVQHFTKMPLEKLFKFPIWSEIDANNPKKSFE